MKTSESIANISGALLAFKSGAFHKDAVNPFHKNKYVTLDAVMAAMDVPMAEAGLVLTQWPTTVSSGDTIESGLCSRLIHVPSGEWMESTVPFVGLSAVGSNPAQALGIYITYTRRYSRFAIFGLPGEKDDDGNAAVPATEKKAANKPKSTTQPAGSAEAALRAVGDAKTAGDVHALYAANKSSATDEGWQKDLWDACVERGEALSGGG